MRPKWIALLIVTTIGLSCASGPAPERPPEYVREGVYHQNVGVALYDKGCYARAMDYFQDAHELYAAADDQAGVVRALNSIADTYFRLGDMKSALLVYDEVVEFSTAGKRDTDLYRALSNKAAALIALDRMETAASVLDRVEAMADKGGQRALYLKTRALWLIKAERFRQAGDFLEKALDAFEGSHDGMAGSIYFSMGRLLLASDQSKKARSRFEQALAVDRASGRHHDTARDLEAIADTYAAMGDHADAAHFYTRGAKIYALLKDGQGMESVLPKLENSAAMAHIDIQATRYWIQKWRQDASGSLICD
jgi:tetratricopeptide (TPR) repeat protein